MSEPSSGMSSMPSHWCRWEMCAVSMLPSIACTQLQVLCCLVAMNSAGVQPVGAEVPERRHGLARPEVGPDDAAGLVGGVGPHPDLLAERRRLARHVHAAAFGVVRPAVVDAAEGGVLVAAVVQRRAAVRAVLLHQADAPGGVAEGDQVLAQQPDPGGRAARLGDLGRQAGRRPVPAQQLAHQRPGPDTGQDLVVFRLKHAGASYSRRTLRRRWGLREWRAPASPLLARGSSRRRRWT